METQKDFGEKILGLGEKAALIMNEYFDGKRGGTDKIKEASMMIREAGRAWNRNRIDESVKRSQAISLVKVIPKETRDAFLGSMIPEVKPFLLLGRPGKAKA